MYQDIGRADIQETKDADADVCVHTGHVVSGVNSNIKIRIRRSKVNKWVLSLLLQIPTIVHTIVRHRILPNRADRHT